MNRAGRFTQLLFYACVVVFVSGCSGCWTNWQETYRYDKKQPYDLFVLYELLEARPESLVFVEDSLASLQDAAANSANYIFIGEYSYYNERSVTQLLDFVERGNTAFIAANDLPEDLARHLFGNDCYYSFYNDSERIGFLSIDTVTMQLDSHDYTLFNIYDYEPYNRTTRYLNGGMLCDTLLDNEVLGTLDDYNINFTRLGWGDGSFYFHNNPVFFTNYYLVDSLQHEYAEAVLSILDDGPVYWDEVSRVPPSVARQRNRQANNNQGQGYSGGRNLLTGNEALSYIQEQPPLALAWYTLLLATLLYVIFRGKRRQRIIPIINRRENSSKRFIDTISRLVFQKGHHIALARQELASLRFFLQDRFTVRWKEGEPPPKNLAELIGGDEEIAHRALAEIRFVQSKKHLTDGELVRFYRAIEPLYRL
ncbi:DUF4350 domain-containing protein [Neolewinella aurantiaca]|uniref:DUF4350 domain-containing protein n=1 Tax=Neolewinella aurantiaca TaxID=2602767 RepID=A0A5C7FL90_9BACT|nr:DUF4350 domain-containing protein [Neolewinella aurantiaca]TXF87104.1 DUF4350 domain-containing protein [Neolewinella aurantiaca]